MSELWLGLVIGGPSVSGVLLDRAHDPPELVDQFTWSLQQGGRPEAYVVMHERLFNFVRDQQVSHVVIKASAAARAGASLKHLESAELRGVAIAATASAGAGVHLLQKAVVTRTYGERSADEYVADDDFWTNQVTGDVAKTRREAALLILATPGA